MVLNSHITHEGGKPKVHSEKARERVNKIRGLYARLEKMYIPKEQRAGLSYPQIVAPKHIT